MIKIRPMRETDASAAAELEAQVFSEPWSESAFCETLTYDYTYYYTAKEDALEHTEEGGELIGICGLRNIAGEGEITNVAVRGDYRRKGIAELLLRETLKKGNEIGIRKFTLEVRSSNIPAIRLYEKLGFRSEGMRKNFYANPTEDALIMWKG